MYQMFKTKKILACVGILLALCIGAFAQGLVLCLDSDNVPQKMPKNFRMFPEFKMSGSAMFSESGLQAIKQNIPANKVTIVDLRQESHGLVNGIAVEWYGSHNAANAGMSLPEIVADEQNKLNGLLQDKEMALALKTKKDGDTGEMMAINTATIAVERVQTEEQLVQSLGFNYFRLPVTDHRRPTDSDVDQFISFIRALPADTWLHFHCRAGKGRTTTFMVMYDMMQNAKNVSMEEIFARQASAGGIDFEAGEYGDWRQQYAEDRNLFIKNFYEYCRTNNDGYATSWNSWLASRTSK